MKKIIALTLSLVMFVSCILFTSCDAIEIVESIDGYTARQAFENAYAPMTVDGNYKITLSMEEKLTIGSIKLKLFSLKEYYTDIYDGDNEYHGVSEDLDEQLNKPSILGWICNKVLGLNLAEAFYNELKDSELEIWCYEGNYYVRNETSKRKYASYTVQLQQSDYEKAVSTILAEDYGTLTYYRDGDDYYFTVVIEDASKMQLSQEGGVGKEEYKVYLSSSGKLEKIEINLYFNALTVETVLDYSYDNIEVTPPADISEYQ